MTSLSEMSFIQPISSYKSRRKRLFEVDSLVLRKIEWDRYRRFCVAVIRFIDGVERTNKCWIDWVGAGVGTDDISVFYGRNQ